MQLSITDMQRRPFDDSTGPMYPSSLAEVSQAMKGSSAFIPSGPGAHPSIGNPSFKHVRPVTSNGRIQIAPSHTLSPDSIDDAGIRDDHRIQHSGLHAADDREHPGQRASLTHMHSIGSEKVLGTTPTETEYDAQRFVYGLLGYFACGTGIAAVVAFVYRLIDNLVRKYNVFGRRHSAVNVGHPSSADLEPSVVKAPAVTLNSLGSGMRCLVPTLRPAIAPRVNSLAMCASVGVAQTDDTTVTASDGIQILKPDTHRREYGFVELPNKLRAIVGSDPKCDKAGAALCVNSGMCYERQDLPGLAHFLEHMLFTGTKKYPREDEFQEFIDTNGGGSNAYTTCFNTNYMFEIKPDKLEEALDRFSRFFYEPILTRDCTEREINAVDSEFQMGLTNPFWRSVGILNMSANKDHPWHVHCGNNDVLLNGPKERGIDLYEEMLKFYKDSYSANGMTLCVIGRQSVEELSDVIKEKFAPIENKGLTLPLGDAVSSEPPFLREEWNRLLLQAPVKDVRSLTFSWVIPYQAPLWRSKPFDYISHLLGHEGKGSLTALLKARGLITGCYSSGSGWLEGAFSLMNVVFNLTDKGIDAVEEIGTILFTYLGMLQKVPVRKDIFDELKNLRQAQFKFGEDQQPFDLAAETAESLQKFPPSDVFSGGALLYDYDADAIKELLGYFTLDKVRVAHCAKSLADRCTDRDTTYDSPMKFLPLEETWLAAWGAAQKLDSGSADEALAAASAIGLSLPDPNPFVPEDLSVKDLPSTKQPLPSRLSDAACAVKAIYHRQDDVFRQPKAEIVFEIRSPYIVADVESYVKTQLWCAAVQEELNEFSYDATCAGLGYSLGLNGGILRLYISGFSDKLPVLLDAVTSKMRSMTSVPSNIYDIVANAYSDSVQNAAFHSSPLQQCGALYSELLFKDIGFPADKRFHAFQGLTRESLDGVAESILNSCHVEAMVLGNSTPEDARDYAVELCKSLQLENALSSVPNKSFTTLPPGRTLWRVDSSDVDAPSHAVRLCLEMRSSIEVNAKLLVLCNILAPKFFDVLRTQQQLGYIVGLGPQPGNFLSFLVAQVQTEFPPDYVRGRIDAFLDEQFKFVLDSLSEEDFETSLAGVLSELRTKPKNLSEELGEFLGEFSNRTYDFTRRQQVIDELEKPLTLESLRQFLSDVVMEAPRLYIQVKKVLDKPDKELPDGSTMPSDTDDLRIWTAREQTVQDFVSAAEWTSFPTAAE